MFISTKSKYGIRAMAYLSLNYNKRKVTIKEISEKENISIKYLEQIFISLKTLDCLQSVKGSKGGYYLKKKPSEITIYKILNILEKDLKSYNEDYNSETLDGILEKEVWMKLDDKIYEFLKGITLEDIIDKYKNKTVNMFYI
ncbi:RrF2 family transcriptional regulator [Haliovirga abyssi]|uniref:Rrf2 family transcriptional regulator n=1 Tax=Haliovirga abyssi TaxID=2996794 RepID=A0AAU9DMJ0_9FUSO|nr:Rrf2 family transcriptional regulator [Haliovirga abyssi]BDU51237.1 Rrf2 family transcriptional regulator [Haliovirga abyssi]